MDIRGQLMHKENFSDSEKNLADYILANKEEVLDMSVQKLSKATYTSTSTIVRLCQKMGIKGFADFKIRFAAELQKSGRTSPEQTEIDLDFPVDKNDSFFEISQKLHSLMEDTLQDVYQKASVNSFKKALELISRADRTAIFTGGDNYMPALAFQNRMMKINKLITIVPVPYENEQLAIRLGRKDCAIVISYSGASDFLDRTMKHLKQNRVPIVCITARPKSKIGRVSDVILLNTDKESDSVKYSTFASQLGTEYILNTLYLYHFVMDHEANAKMRTESEEQFLDGRSQKFKIR